MKPISSAPAFTFVELLVSVAVVIVVAAVGLPAFLGYRDAALATKCVSRMAVIQKAREAYFSRNTRATAFAAWSDIAPWVGLHNINVQASVAAVSALHQCPLNSAEYVYGLSRDELATPVSCPNYNESTAPGHLLELD